MLPHPVASIKKFFDMPPGTLDCVRMSASSHINGTDRVIHSFVCAAVRFYVPLCRPAVNDDCSAVFDSITKNSYQRVDGSLKNGN